MTNDALVIQNNIYADVELSFIVPVYNEEKTISVFIEKIHQCLSDTPIFYEIIFIDDGSIDTSLTTLKEGNTDNIELLADEIKSTSSNLCSSIRKFAETLVEVEVEVEVEVAEVETDEL